MSANCANSRPSHADHLELLGLLERPVYGRHMERGGDGVRVRWGGCNVVTTEGFTAKGNRDLSLFAKQDVWMGPHTRLCFICADLQIA